MTGKLKINGFWVDPRDEKYILKEAPKGFSVEHNRAVVERTIQKSEQQRQKKWAVWEDKTRERANALASYFKYLDTGRGGSNPFNKYFSRKMRAYLRGEEIVSELQDYYYGRNQFGQVTRYHKQLH